MQRVGFSFRIRLNVSGIYTFFPLSPVYGDLLFFDLFRRAEYCAAFHFYVFVLVCQRCVTH